MKKNVGTIDKAVRILAAAIIVLLYFVHQITGTAAVVLLAVAAIFVATSFMSFCPIYWLTGLSSKKSE